MKVKKDYAYVPEILMLIFRFREQVDQPLRSIAGKKRTGSAITPNPPTLLVRLKSLEQRSLGFLHNSHYQITCTRTTNEMISECDVRYYVRSNNCNQDENSLKNKINIPEIPCKLQLVKGTSV